MKLSSSSNNKLEPLTLNRPNFWSKLSSKTPLPQPSQYSCVSTITDLSTENTSRTKTRPSILKLHITQASPSSIELSALSSRETPYRDIIASRRSPLELDSLLNSINAPKTSARSVGVRLTPIKYEPEQSRLGNYLNYLGSRSSDRDLAVFRNKMVAKMEPKGKGDLYQNWLDELIPTAAGTENDLSSRISTLNQLERSESEARGNSKVILRRNKERSAEINGSRSARTGLWKVREKNKTVESRVEATIAEKLAEDVARNYRLCRENALNNADLKIKLDKILEEEGVLKVFKGTVYTKQLKIAVRVYRDMLNISEKDTNGRLLSVERMLFDEEDQMGLLRKKGRVIRSRYIMYQRINEKLEEMNVDYKVGKVKVLESNLLQAHERLRNKKEATLEKIMRVDREKYEKLKGECENVERLVPVFGEACERGMSKENEGKISKDIRKVNKRLDRAVKNLQGSLLAEKRYR